MYNSRRKAIALQFFFGGLLYRISFCTGFFGECFPLQSASKAYGLLATAGEQGTFLYFALHFPRPFYCLFFLLLRAEFLEFKGIRGTASCWPLLASDSMIRVLMMMWGKFGMGFIFSGLWALLSPFSSCVERERQMGLIRKKLCLERVACALCCGLAARILYQYMVFLS